MPLAINGNVNLSTTRGNAKVLAIRWGGLRATLERH